MKYKMSSPPNFSELSDEKQFINFKWSDEYCVLLALANGKLMVSKASVGTDSLC